MKPLSYDNRHRGDRVRAMGQLVWPKRGIAPDPGDLLGRDRARGPAPTVSDIGENGGYLVVVQLPAIGRHSRRRGLGARSDTSGAPQNDAYRCTCRSSPMR